MFNMGDNSLPFFFTEIYPKFIYIMPKNHIPTTAISLVKPILKLWSIADKYKQVNLRIEQGYKSVYEWEEDYAVAVALHQAFHDIHEDIKDNLNNNPVFLN